MGTVDVGIGHDDDAVVAGLIGIEIVTDVGSDCGDQRTDSVRADRAGEAGALDVEDLATKRKDCLVLAVAGLFGRTTCGIALYNEKF